MRAIKKAWADIAPRWEIGAGLSEEDAEQLWETVEAELQEALRQLVQITHCEELLKEGNFAELKSVLDKWE